MVSAVVSGALCGLQCVMISVEADISKGMPCFELVGYLSSEVREAKERVRIALKNAGVVLPPMRITVNLSPVNLRKDGNAYDLPIAVGILLSMGLLPEGAAKQLFFAGELGLDGAVRKIRGVLPLVLEARNQGMKQCILPLENVNEGAAVNGIEVIGVRTLQETIAYLQKKDKERKNMIAPAAGKLEQQQDLQGRQEDFADIIGQESAKRAAEIAAAGFHNLLLIGPPGSGKTMIAQRIPSILPPMSREESLEVSAIYSISGNLPQQSPILVTRPFLNPHHTISPQALAGGGGIPRPGMISLAHRGILFLDELAEFKRSTLDILRQPMEEKEVCIARSYGMFRYPADFMLVAATNPCPCGYYPDRGRCRCSDSQIRRYLGHISGPVLDRIDLCVETEKADPFRLPGVHGRKQKKEEDSMSIRRRVQRAREIQQQRYRETPYRFNADLPARVLKQFCPLGHAEQLFMEKLYDRMGLSLRAYHRIIRTARTISDLSESQQIEICHLSEAACYKMNHQKYWES